MKIKFNSDDDIPLNKQLNFLTITVIIRNILKRWQVLSTDFLDECLYEYKMLLYERIDFDKSNKSVECMI